MTTWTILDEPATAWTDATPWRRYTTIDGNKTVCDGGRTVCDGEGVTTDWTIVT